jgi:hypothetical protein
MTYYKVKAQFDQYHISRTAYTLIRGELFTDRELRKNRVPTHMVEAVTVSPADITLKVGSRFDRRDENPWFN